MNHKNTNLKQIAEKFYIKANHPKTCIEMYNRAGKWDRAFKATFFEFKSQFFSKIIKRKTFPDSNSLFEQTRSNSLVFGTS